MKIKELLARKKPTLSFEVFPPKTAEKYASIEKATIEIAGLHPDFMSVTYGAGGGTSKHTVSITSTLKNDYHVPAMAHLTCVSSTKETIRHMLDDLKAHNIENVLALRGDLPPEGQPLSPDYQYAWQLVREIKAYGDFCIGAACYPEGHTESHNKDEDIAHLRQKVDEGVDFLTTQMFFDNALLYNFLYRIREAGIRVPVCAGIMPVTNGKQIARICKLSGTYLPSRFLSVVDKFKDKPEAMTQAGIAYATDQIIDLIANGVNHIHVYSMNKPEVAARIKENLSSIIE